eukprot:SAG31_NODE_10402_length_1143_cov_0.745211_2_plen_149_part_00
MACLFSSVHHSQLLLTMACLWCESDGIFTNGTIPAGYGIGPAMKHEFVTAMMKGKVGGFAISGGDAQGGTLDQQYNGPRPSRRPSATGPAEHPYQPMKKQGSIILGIGGDNSAHAGGTWYEGCLTAGISSVATDAKVQANIVAAGFGK